MLDFKKILQLGLGVAIGMIAYHFIQKAMNKTVLDNGAVGASGRIGRRTRPTTISAKAGKRCNCGTSMSPKWINWCRGGSCDQCCGVLEEYGDK